MEMYIWCTQLRSGVLYFFYSNDLYCYNNIDLIFNAYSSNWVTPDTCSMVFVPAI